MEFLHHVHPLGEKRKLTMTTIHTSLSSARRPASLAFAAVLSLAWLAGCASTPADPMVQITERRGEALRLANDAKRAQEAGKLKEAIDLYTRSIESFGEIPGVRTNLGVALLEHGDVMNAADALKEEVLLHPANAQAALVNLGIIYRNAGQPAVAADYFDRALLLTPNDPFAIRGAVETGMIVSRDEEKLLDLVRRGLLVERDPKVIEDYKWRQFRLVDKINTRPKYRASEKHLRPNGMEKPVEPPASEPPADAPK